MCALKLPLDVHQLLKKRFAHQHQNWLLTETGNNQSAQAFWPLEINLNPPSERIALQQPDGVRSWIAAWQTWQGAGTLVWVERHWQTLGVQRLPEKLLLHEPKIVAIWLDELRRWERAVARANRLIALWPVLHTALPKHFKILADYTENDFSSLVELLAWLLAHPHSNLYPRQLPIAGIDSKWLESRTRVITDFLAVIKGNITKSYDFYQQCGLRAKPKLIRLRILDYKLQQFFSGLDDISAPWEQIAVLELPIKEVIIVENLQTFLAFTELPGTVLLIGSGYHLDFLAQLPWLSKPRCTYWGDLDTHGFAILNRAREYLPTLQSILMDEATLLKHKPLWVVEEKPHCAQMLPNLSANEQYVYSNIKCNHWGQQIRLEQERIAWDYAWHALQQKIFKSVPIV
jgi:hypothetical protein